MHKSDVYKRQDYDKALDEGIRRYLHRNICQERCLKEAIPEAQKLLYNQNMDKKRLEEEIVSSVMYIAERISEKAVTFTKEHADSRDRKIDSILTSRRAGYPLMAALLMAVLWLTITGANYPLSLIHI